MIAHRLFSYTFVASFSLLLVFLAFSSPFAPLAIAAGCSAEESASVKRLIVGSWRNFVRGQPGCTVQTFARRGLYKFSATDCNRSNNSDFEGTWEVQDDCTLKMTFDDGGTAIWVIDFVSDNEFVKRGDKGITNRRE